MIGTTKRIFYKSKLFIKQQMPPQLAGTYINRLWERESIPVHQSNIYEKANSISECEFKVLSQNGEDGIIDYLFYKIGAKNRFFIEIGFGCTEANSLRLMLHEGWSGLFIDGSEVSATHFNKAAAVRGRSDVRALSTFVNRENINTILACADVPTEIDLFSLDIDGNDYWVWEALERVKPRVIVIEYNASFGPEKAVTIPYDPDFSVDKPPYGKFYAGASIAALEKLGKRKGYHLLGCDSAGVNAFFVRADEIRPGLTPIDAATAYRPNRGRVAMGLSPDEQFAVVADRPLIEVG